MTAEEARNSRYSAEDEKLGHKNTFNLLVSDYINDIERNIRKVMRYTNAVVYSLKDLCNRIDIVDEIVRQLKEEGFEVEAEPYCGIELDMFWYDLYITWRKQKNYSIHVRSKNDTTSSIFHNSPCGFDYYGKTNFQV